MCLENPKIRPDNVVLSEVIVVIERLLAIVPNFDQGCSDETEKRCIPLPPEKLCVDKSPSIHRM